MGLITQKSPTKFKNKNEDNKTMGLLLIFFPEFHNPKSNNNHNALSPIRTTSLILTKTQYTISICLLLLFFSLLFFSLSTFEPTIPIPTTNIITIHHRRFLSSSSPTQINSNTKTRLLDFFIQNKPQSRPKKNLPCFALQGMGTLFMRGTISVSDLVVAHVTEEVTPNDLRLFLRLLHRSGVTAKSDVVFLFGSSYSVSRFSELIHEENDSFRKLIELYRERNETDGLDSAFTFAVGKFLRRNATGEPLWGKKSGNRVNESESDSSESTKASYGSILGFEVNELDPENSLGGFVDDVVPVSLRRWASYPMLLGRVRHNFKHVMLVDVKSALLLGEPLGRITKKVSPDSVHCILKQEDKRNPAKSPLVKSAMIMGGGKGVRRLSNLMLSEIVRSSIQQQTKKKKNKNKKVISESVILNQVVENVHITKNFNLITSSESLLKMSSLSGLGSKSLDYTTTVINSGNSNYDDIMKELCSAEIDSSVYRDC